MLSVTLDATPLLGALTGIGRYTEQLLLALQRQQRLDLRATAFTLRGAGALAETVPAGVDTRCRPVPARLLRVCWRRAEYPTAGVLGGRSDVFHATNFVLPPPGRAAGVVTIHDLTFLRFPGTLDAAGRQLIELVPRSLRRAAMVLTPTMAIADELADAYPLPADRIRVTPHGVAQEWFDAEPPSAQQRAAWGLPERYLLFVGTREPRKDLRTLLAAHAIACDEDASTPPLVLVGPPGWGSEPEPTSDVRLLGYQDQRRLPQIVAGASALVVPSLYEGFGIPAVEALATGVRTIVSDDPALVEVTGGHAESFAVGDQQALAALLSAPQEQPASGTDQRQRRREHARQFTWERCAELTTDAYQAAAAG